MITRVSEIRGIGCLKHMRPGKGEELAFGGRTVIYAPNAMGKTTLAAVLKSYGIEDSSLVTSRVTLSGTATPFAVIEVDGKPRRFQNGAWQGREDGEYRLAVFDHAFIEENVFSSEVTPDHLKTIHRVIIGEAGAALNTTLEQAKEKERTTRRGFRDLQTELAERQVKTGRQDYLLLPSVVTVATAARELTECEGTLKAIKDAENIAKLPVPAILPFVLGDFAALRTAVSATVVSVHAQARQRVQERIRTVLGNAVEAESFLETGQRLRPADRQCPFCGQNTAPAADLLLAYEKFFDETFASTKKSVTERVKRFSQWSPTAQLRELQTAWAQAVATREKWLAFIPSLPPLSDVGATVEDALSSVAGMHEACVTEMEKRVASLDAQLDLAPLAEMERLLRIVKEHADNCARNCSAIAARIGEFRQGLGQLDADTTAKELVQRRAIVEALGLEAEEWRKRYRNAEAQVTADEKVRTRAEADLAAYCKETYGKFQESINDVLKNFGLRYTVGGLKPQSTQQSSQVSAGMSFVVDGRSVSASKRQTDVPCFRNTLSEGEKSALAFAFFLASLRRKTDLDRTVVLLDDPLSSFDDDRRETTANLLARLSGKCRQLIVLTHRMDFVGLLHGQPGFDGRFLRLAGDETQGVRLEPLDVKETQRLDYEKQVSALEAFASSGKEPTGDSVQLLIRRVLEHVLRAIYCRRLTGERELTALLGRLSELSILSPAVAEELQYLNDRSQIGCHAASDQDPVHSLTTPELQVLARKTLEVIEKV